MLARIRGDERHGGRGRLRVYLGMAPGVGKTYRMLEEGHRRVERGHGPRRRLRRGARPAATRASCSTASRSCRAGGSSTAASSSRRWTPTRSSPAHPTVALVDELAHTNAPGSARAKRWEDVEVIRDAGIDVVTTMQRPAPRVASPTRSRRSPARRSTSGIPDEVLAARRRGRARRHEPARPPPADAPRQRLSARADRRSRSTGSSPSRT